MSKYEVYVACVLREYIMVTVEADSEDDAEDAARDVAMVECERFDPDEIEIIDLMELEEDK